MSWEKDGEAIEEKKNTKLRFERAVRSIRRIGSDKLDLLPNISTLFTGLVRWCIYGAPVLQSKK